MWLLISCVMWNHIMEAGWLRPSWFCGVIFNAPDKKIVNQPYCWQFPITVVGQMWCEDYPGTDKSPGPWQSHLQKNQICLLLIIDGMPSGLLVHNVCITFFFSSFSFSNRSQTWIHPDKLGLWTFCDLIALSCYLIPVCKTFAPLPTMA